MTERHILIYKNYHIRVSLKKEGGLWKALSFSLFKNGRCLNAKMSEKVENKINKLVSAYAHHLNKGIQ